MAHRSGALGRGRRVGDIGTHAYNLACFVSGWMPRRSRPTSRASSTGRALDDNVHVMLRYASGARGMFWASQVAPGNENRLVLRVHGTKAGLEWAQEQPNYAVVRAARRAEAPDHARRRGEREGRGARHPRAGRASRGLSRGLRHDLQGGGRGDPRGARWQAAPDDDVIFPTVEDGVKGVAFVEACVRSSKRNAAWVTL